jgi:hypothetical protein
MTTPLPNRTVKNGQLVGKGVGLGNGGQFSRKSNAPCGGVDWQVAGVSEGHPDQLPELPETAARAE